MSLARETVELLLQTARIAEAQGSEHGLRATEWTALRFLVRANQFSRTPSALANILAATRATASQVVKELEAKRILERERSESDGRSVVLRVTAKGQKALADDPLGPLLKALENLDNDDQTAVAEALRHALKSLSAHVDVCRDCVLLTRTNTRNGSDPDKPEYKCRYFGAAIDPDEIDLLCVSFQPPPPTR